MTAAPAKRRATYADVLAAPDHVVAELVHGALVTQPRPSPRHAVATVALGRVLSGPLLGGPSGEDGWIFMSEPELHLGHEILVPDLAAWRRSRLPRIPDEPYMTLAPDWACEVLSPSTEGWDRGPKRRIYGEAGIGHLWLVDPRAKFIEAFGLVDGRWLLLGTAGDGEQVRLAPFDAVSFAIGALWPLDPPPAAEEAQ